MYHSEQRRSHGVREVRRRRRRPARAWAVLSDLERWPERIATYEEVRRLDDGDLRVGSRAFVKQKGLAAGEWEVSELVAGTTFTWASRQPGVRIVGRHHVTTDATGATRLTPGPGADRLAERHGLDADRAQDPGGTSTSRPGR